MPQVMRVENISGESVEVLIGVRGPCRHDRIEHIYDMYFEELRCADCGVSLLAPQLRFSQE